MTPEHAPYEDTVLACRREFTQVARSFWLVPALIEQPARDDVSLLYCVCRRLDDDIDEATSRDAAHEALGRWRRELAGEAPRPLVAAFLAGVPRNGVPLACMGHLLDGMEQDLADVRIADDAELVRYAYRVSSAVGLMLAPLLGVRGERAEQRVVDLGIALQLTNVLLGLGGDAARGRVYLPATRLAAVGITADDVLEDRCDLTPVLRGIADLADRYYASAVAGVACVPLRYRHGVVLLARAYGALGWRVVRGEAAPDAPAELPLSTKLLRLGELALTGWHPRTLGFVAPPPHEPDLHRALAGWRGAHDAP